MTNDELMPAPPEGEAARHDVASVADKDDSLVRCEQELAASREEVSALRTQLQGEREIVAKLKLEEARLHKEIGKRFQELAILTQHLERRGGPLPEAGEPSAPETQQGCVNPADVNGRLAQDLERLKSANHELEVQVADLSARLGKAQEQYRKIRNTLSWRITAPARSFAKFLRRSGTLKPNQLRSHGK
jgi:septal ring factor EnvC (AmiA/AmiB activator)